MTYLLHFQFYGFSLWDKDSNCKRFHFQVGIHGCSLSQCFRRLESVPLCKDVFVLVYFRLGLLSTFHEVFKYILKMTSKKLVKCREV